MLAARARAATRAAATASGQRCWDGDERKAARASGGTGLWDRTPCHRYPVQFQAAVVSLGVAVISFGATTVGLGTAVVSYHLQIL